VLDPINNDIKTYNAYTSFCASHPHDGRCGSTTTGAGAAACFMPGGAPDPACASGSIANPYWNAPVQNLLNPSASYYPTDVIISSPTIQADSYPVPHVAALLLQYKHRRWSVNPAFQLFAGQRYGAPESVPGIDPAQGCGALPGGLANDPRYPYGGAGGAPYNAATCNGALNAIPDPFTGAFDQPGAFVAPAYLTAHLSLSYAVSPSATLTISGTNLFSTCFGGSKEPWTGMGGHSVCGYVAGGGGPGTGILPAGNVYNPGATFQPFVQFPYQPLYGVYNVDRAGGGSVMLPPSIYVTLKFKV